MLYRDGLGQWGPCPGRDRPKRLPGPAVQDGLLRGLHSRRLAISSICGLGVPNTCATGGTRQLKEARTNSIDQNNENELVPLGITVRFGFRS